MGDSQQLFANHFFTKADVYFHSGYYPSVFDQAIGGAPHMTAAKDAATETDEEHGREHAEETTVRVEDVHALWTGEKPLEIAAILVRLGP